MPSTYTTNLGIQKIASGEQTGTWGDSTNTNWDLVDEAINGSVAITLPAVGSTGTPNDVPITDGASSTGRNKFIVFTSAGDLGGTAYVRLTPNDAEKIVHIRNSLTGGRQIIIFQGTYNASNDFVIPNGADVLLRFDGGGAGAVVSDVFTNLTPTGMTIGTITATTYVGLPTASDTVAGIIEIATAAEANTGTDNTRAVSPLALEGWTGSTALNTFGVVSTIDINGGTVDGAVIGGTAAAAGTFTTLTATTYVGLPAASTTVAGIIEIATAAEANTGTDNVRAVSPLALEGWTGSTAVTTLGTITAGTWQGGVIAEAYLQNQSGTNTGDEPSASTTVEGVIELATQVEVDAGVDAVRAVTPATLAAYSGLVGGGTLSALTDVTLTTPADLHVLQYNFGTTQWVNRTLSAAGIAPTASPTFTGTASFAGATISNLGAVTTADINGGTIDGTAIGGSVPSTATFTTLGATTYTGLPTASTTASGIIEIATATEGNTGTDNVRAMSPLALATWAGNTSITKLGTIATGTWNGSVIAEAYLQNQSGTNTGDEPAASTTVSGVVELATQVEVDAGTDAVRAVTPATLANYAGLGAGGSLPALSDVTITTLADLHILQYDNGTTQWVNRTLAAAGAAPTASPTFTGTISFSGATISNLGTVTTADINGGTIDGTNIGSTIAGTGNFSTLSIGGTAITATAAELNIIDGVTASATELNYNDITTLGTVQANKTVTAAASAINFNSFGMNNVDINSGTIDGTTIGAAAAAAGTFTTLTATTYVGLPSASTTASGIVELAIQAEVDAGTDAVRAVTPATLAAYSGLGASNLNALSDVTIATVADKHVLQYDNGTTQWVNRTLAVAGIAPTASPTFTGTISFSGATISNLGTVTTADINGGTVDGAVIGGAAAAAGTFTTLTGTTYVGLPVASTTVSGIIEIADQTETNAGISTTLAVTPATLAAYSGLGGSVSLDELTDVTITTAADLHVLQYNSGTSQWVNRTLATAGIAPTASPTFTGTISFSGATISNLGTVTTADINGGTIDGTNVGSSVAGTGNFTTLSINGTAITATASELNVLDGVTASFAELNYNDITTLGVAQTSKVLTVSGTSTINLSSYATTNVNIDSGAIDGTPIGANSANTGNFSTLSIGGTAITSTAAELNYVDGVTSAIQTQLNAKAPTASPTFTGTTTVGALTLGAEVVETVYTVSGTTPALDPANGTIQSWTLTANSTPTATFASGESITLRINATNYTITWTSILAAGRWAGGAAPTLASSGYTWVTLWNVGGTMYGAIVGNTT